MYLLAISLLAAITVQANPLKQSSAGPVTLVPRSDPGGCGDTSDSGQSYVADIGYFSDNDCTQFIYGICVYAPQNVIDTGSGAAECDPAGAPSTTPYYAQVMNAAFSDMQMVYTRDQSCPPSGPGAVFATLEDNGSCVEMNVGGDSPGITVFPHGGSGLAKKKTKRDNQCSGFRIDSQTPSESRSVQVSQIVDCTNSASGVGCSITESEQYSESISTSYSVTAGGGIEGVFSVETTFGQEYTEEVTTSIQDSFSIDSGQRGYLSSYCVATLFNGAFTGCSEGDSEQPGQAVVLQSNGLSYEIIYTGA